MTIPFAKPAGLLCIALLTACGGGGASGSNPVTGGVQLVATDPVDPTDPTVALTNGIPTELANNLLGVTYDPGNQTLTLELESFDAAGEQATFLRRSDLDPTVNGYQAYVRQDDPSDRFFLAIGGSSVGGEVSAVVVTDGGQFNRFFGGGFYQQDSTYEVDREQGLVSYAGNYAGTTNINAPGTNLATPLPVAAVRPREPAAIQGDIFLNVTFSDDSVNGSIFNRRFTDYPTIDLPDISLVEGELAEDGTFLGSAEIEVERPIGRFGGTLGGEGGTALAGTTSLTEFSDDLENEEEYGLFVLERCGTANENATLCANVNP